jgi:hypothetical protein
MAEDTRQPTGSAEQKPGPFLAKVISHLDPTYMGTLQVQLLREVGNDEAKEGQLHQVKYLTPFGGQTNVEYITEEDDYNATQKSYGMWFIPPDVGTIVMVIFIDGDPRKGYWIGCVPDENMNFQVPGHAATKYNIDGTYERVPVAEYNKKAREAATDPTKILKPASLMQDILDEQGLIEDDTRGITTSSARREIPSMVFGISTPGPVDKRGGAPKGKFGKDEHKIAAGFISRLGGSSMVMDDGDDKFLRRTTASEGPPDYAAVEQDEDDGLPEIPHNELIRFRTRTGHQILMHNSEDLIYIGNARGTTWIEMSSDGKIDIFAEDSISVHTKNDINFLADRDINFEAGRNINIKAAERMQAESKNYNLVVTEKGKITVGTNFHLYSGSGNSFTTEGTTNIKSSGQHLETASQIHMNGPAAATAETESPLTTFESPTNIDGETIRSIMLRVPTHEPWPHHENLDPVSVNFNSTDREAGSDIPVPEYWKKYSTITDTFSKEMPPENEE